MSFTCFVFLLQTVYPVKKTVRKISSDWKFASNKLLSSNSSIFLVYSYTIQVFIFSLKGRSWHWFTLRMRRKRASVRLARRAMQAAIIPSLKILKKRKVQVSNQQLIYVALIIVFLLSNTVSKYLILYFDIIMNHVNRIYQYNMAYIL